MNPHRRIEFSLFVPSFNGGRDLRACLASVLAQDYPHFEVIVLDDNSTDGSLRWLESLRDGRLRVFGSQHLGIVKNWNRALALPKNEFMAFVGQDDWLDPHYLSTFVALIEKEPHAGLYHAAFRFINAKSRTVRASRVSPARETASDWLRAHFRGQRDTWGAGYVWRSADFDRIGGVPPFESLLFADDALWLSLMSQSFKATSPRECFAIRLHTHSTGRAAPWQSWHSALRDYIPFLQQLAARDADFAAALREVGPDYFLKQCEAFYLLSLAQASKNWTATRGEALELLGETLAPIAPQKVANLQAFGRGAACRKRLFINRNLVARTLYNLVLLARYREWRGRRLF